MVENQVWKAGKERNSSLLRLGGRPMVSEGCHLSIGY